MNFSILFKRLGFGKNAHKIYDALLRNPKPLLVIDIARRGEITRPEVYRNIKKLVAHEFIKKEIVGKRTSYRAETPTRIAKAFREISKKVEKLTDKLSRKTIKMLPAHVRYFKGFKGIRAVFDDVVNNTPRQTTFYRYTSERDLAAVNRYLSPQYRAKRDTKKLERLVISNPLSGRQKRSRLERFIKFIPPEADLFDQNIIQLVYADYLAFINLNNEEAFVIKDKALAHFQAVIFNQLYKKL